MVITKIEKQKKDKNRYNIHIDDEFAFGLFEDTVLKFGLRTKDEVDDSKVKEMKEFDEYGYGKKIAYAYLSYRQRSKKELTTKLKEKKISAETIQKVLDLLEKQKYIDDKSYAKNYLESKTRGKSIGRRLVKMKLQEKGIDKDLAEDTIAANYSEDKETELAVKLLKKYEKKIKYKNESDKRSKSCRYLISRGFDYEISLKAYKIACSGENG